MGEQRSVLALLHKTITINRQPRSNTPRSSNTTSTRRTIMGMMITIMGMRRMDIRMRGEGMVGIRRRIRTIPRSNHRSRIIMGMGGEGVQCRRGVEEEGHRQCRDRRLLMEREEATEVRRDREEDIQMGVEGEGGRLWRGELRIRLVSWRQLD
jgi:hypothetical protein